jgi:TRAP transporter TAXI family solute receptor
MRKPLFRIAMVLGLVVICGALAFFAFRQYPWMFSGRYTIRIATGPLGGEGAKFVAAFKREMANEHPRVQVVLTETASLKASAEALQAKQVDAAVMRSDDPAAAEGRTIIIFRKVFAALMVPTPSNVDGVAGLAGKKIGVIAAGNEIDPLAKTVLEFLGINQSNVVPLLQKDIAPALQHKRVAALMAVGPSGPGNIAEAVRIVRSVTKKPPSFIDLDEADAISNRYPVYDSDEIPAAAFVGLPAVPSDSVTTVAATVRLVATPSLSNFAAGELTRLLLATKAKVASSIPGAGEITAPDTDLSTIVLPVHPGTLAYLNGTQPDILDEAQNIFYLGSLILAVLGSLGAWAVSLRNKRKLKELQARLGRISPLLNDAKSAPADRIDQVEEELERISEWMTEKFVQDEIQPDDFRNMTARISHIQAIIGKRRGGLPAPVP